MTITKGAKEKKKGKRENIEYDHNTNTHSPEQVQLQHV